MKIEFREEPWKHIIASDFFDTLLFEKVEKEFGNKEEVVQKEVYHYNFGSIMPKRLHGEYSDLTREIANHVISIYNEFYDSLNTTEDKKFEVTPKDIQIEFQKRPPNEDKIWNDPNIHPDSDAKIMSFVVYVSEYGAGTALYTHEMKYHSITEWKKNDALIFVRNTEEGKKTYHSIVNNVDYERRALVVFVTKPEVEK